MADKCYVCGITWADWWESYRTVEHHFGNGEVEFGDPCEEGDEHDWED